MTCAAIHEKCHVFVGAILDFLLFSLGMTLLCACLSQTLTCAAKGGYVAKSTKKRDGIEVTHAIDSRHQFGTWFA